MSFERSNSSWSNGSSHSTSRISDPSAVLEAIIADEQEKMKRLLGFVEMFVPERSGAATDAVPDTTARAKYFVSSNFLTCSRLLLIIGSGKGVQPGIWSRSLVLDTYQEFEANLSSQKVRNGSMLPYLHTALQDGYGVIVFNPYTNSIRNPLTGEKTVIVGSETPEAHVSNVWQRFTALRNEVSLVHIMAYGRGCELAKHLVLTFPALCNKLAAMAFVESSHRINVTTDSQALRNLYGTRAINWQRSNEPAGKELSNCDILGCLSISAGSPHSNVSSSNTAWTIGASMPTVFAFFESAQGSLPPSTAGMDMSSPYDEELDDDMVTVTDEEEGRGKSMVISTSMSVKDFDLLSVVGKGAYGKVFLAKKKGGKCNGKVYAMKVLKKCDVFKKKQVEHTKSEQRILKHVTHPFVVRLRYAFQSDVKLYLVMDYYNGGSLFVHLRKARRFVENQARYYAAQLFLAISHLHSLHIMYRDLKLENILMDGDGNIAITDFGLSKEDDLGSTFVGTPEYLAPELLSSQRTSTSYGNSIDWWSYGVLVYEMMRGQTPFWDKNRRQMFQNILTGEPHFPKELFSPAATDFLQRMLIKSPTQRLGCTAAGVDEIKHHPWFNGMDWNGLLNKTVQPPYLPSVKKLADTRYVPQVFQALDVADTPVTNSMMMNEELATPLPGRATMHFDGFSYMGSVDAMGSSRHTSIFRESDLRMELDDLPLTATETGAISRMPL